MDKLNSINQTKNINTLPSKSMYIIFSIIILFILLRIFKYLETEYFIIWFDSAQFGATSFASIWTKLYWSDGIPPLYPFFLKYFHSFGIGNTVHQIDLFSIFVYEPKIIKGIENMPDYPFYLIKDNFDVISISILQLILSISSWIIFAVSFSKKFSNFYIQLISIVTLLLLGSESSVTLWDKHVLTESFSISILILTISFLIHIKIVMDKNLFVLLFIFLLIFLSLIKITNNYMLFLLIPFIIFNLWNDSYKNKSRYAIVLMTLMSLFIFNQYMLFKGDRTHVPMKDLISSRISTDGYEDIYKYFRQAGMPQIPDIVIGKLWTAPFKDYPELYEWWISKSSKTYQEYLITHPDYFFLRPFQYKNESNKPVYSYLTPDLHFHEQVAPNKLQVIFTDTFLWLALCTIFLLLMISFIKKRLSIFNLITPIFLLFISSCTYLIIWHADLGELDRHLIQNALLIRIFFLMMMIVLLDNIFDKSK